jgi:predicted amidohydrolase YtcJ
MAIAGGRIVFVGAAGSARRLLRPGGRLIELGPEEMVLPGLIDSHVHMLDAGLARQRCVLDEAKTPEQVLKIIADYARDNPGPDLPWVIGGGWASTLFNERGPTASALDAVVPDRPAVFYDQDGHSAWVTHGRSSRPASRRAGRSRGAVSSATRREGRAAPCENRRWIWSTCPSRPRNSGWPD